MDQKFQNRTFRIWEYRVSHSQLLLRSQKSSQHPRNCDIVFVGVEYMNVPAYLSELTIVAAEKDEVTEVGHLLRKDIKPPQLFVLISQGQRFFVLAAGMRVAENDLDLFESSLEDFHRNDSKLF